MVENTPSSVVDFRNNPKFGHIIQTALESPWGTTRGGVGATQYIDDSQKSELAETFIRHYTRDLDTADKALDHLGTVLAHLGQPGAAFDKRTCARELIAKLRLWMRNNMVDQVIRGGDSAPSRLQHTPESIQQIKDLAALGSSLHAAWREAWNSKPVAQSAHVDDDEEFKTDIARLTATMREILIAVRRANLKGRGITRYQLVTALKAEQPSVIDNAISRMRAKRDKKGFELDINNDGSGAGYQLRGRAIRLADALLAESINRG